VGIDTKETSLALNEDNFGVADGVVRMVWAGGEHLSLNDETQVFNLKFRVLTNTDVKLSDVLTLHDSDLDPLAFDVRMPMPLQLKYTAPASLGQGLSVVSVYPNPFSDRVTMNFVMPETGEMKTNLYSLDGRLVWSATTSFPAGANEMTIETPEEVVPGVYHCEMVTKFGSYTVKLVKVNE